MKRRVEIAILRNLALAFAFGVMPIAAQLPDAGPPAYKDTHLPFEQRAADLVSRMTLGEKASQRVNDAAAIPRLGIREYNWWNEGLHGVAAAGYATVFPQAIGMAASFDANHIAEIANVISIEFRATVMNGKAYSVMCAYNAVNGIPACASRELLTDYLRGAWGFGGYVVSDCGAVADIYRDDHHGYSETPEKGIAAAFEAGMDLICGDAVETGHIISAVKTGVLDEPVIDRSLVRLFTARRHLDRLRGDLIRDSVQMMQPSPKVREISGVSVKYQGRMPAPGPDSSDA